MYSMSCMHLWSRIIHMGYRSKKSNFPSFYKVPGQRLYANFSGVTFSPPLMNSSPNSHTPQNYDPLSGYERKLLSPIKSLRNKESNSSKEGITSMLPVITFPWFLPSLGGVACDPDIPDDEVVPVVTPFGA